jgi:hypothetical protein
MVLKSQTSKDPVEIQYGIPLLQFAAFACPFQFFFHYLLLIGDNFDVSYNQGIMILSALPKFFIKVILFHCSA